MTELAGFAAHDRVLVAAPHPDDESLATGGVLQAAGAAGSARRVLIITDGDKNPWPQRWAEKRWHLGPAERARWGARRRSEALAALSVLGISDADVRCYGMPDLGLTGALMRGSPDVVTTLQLQLEQFGPTHLFLPALGDRHPDHSALHVLMRLALLRSSGVAPRLHAFAVHGTPGSGGVVLKLSDAQRETKRTAILQHATQMRLSRRRFLAYAKDVEPFAAVAWQGEADPGHPLQARFDTGGLRVVVDHARWRGSLRDHALYIVLRREYQEPLRCVVDLAGPAQGSLRDSATDAPIGQFAIERGTAASVFRIPAHPGAGWAKLARRHPGLFVFDRFGWQVIGGPTG